MTTIRTKLKDIIATRKIYSVYITGRALVTAYTCHNGLAMSTWWSPAVSF